jgi:hypothetical protein
MNKSMPNLLHFLMILSPFILVGQNPGSISFNCTLNQQILEICQGTSQIDVESCTEGNPATYFWFLNGDEIEGSNADSLVLDTENLAAGNYTLQRCIDFEDALECVQLSFEVLALPSPQIQGPQSLCEGTNLELFVENIYSSYNWSNNGGTGFIANYSNLPLGTSTFSISVTNAQGCSGEDEKTVNVVKNPGPPLVSVKVPNLVSVCPGTKVKITSAGGGDPGLECQFGFRQILNGDTLPYTLNTEIFSLIDSIVIQGRRLNCATGCNDSPWGTLAVWRIAAPAVNPSVLSLQPNQEGTCIGSKVSMVPRAGSGGVGCSDFFQYRINAGNWLAYTPGQDITVSGDSIQIRGRRAGCNPAAGCSEPDWVVLANWKIYPVPAAGSIDPMGIEGVCAGESVEVNFAGGQGGGPGAIDSFVYNFIGAPVTKYDGAIETGNHTENGSVLNFRSFRVSPLLGCIDSITTLSIDVYSLPKASLRFMSAEGVTDRVCQLENLSASFEGSNGLAPYTFNTSFGEFESNPNGSFSYELDTEEDGVFSIIFFKVEDQRGCERNIGTVDNYRIWRNPIARITSLSPLPAQVDLEFTLTGENSSMGSIALEEENFLWTFDPKIMDSNQQILESVLGSKVERARASEPGLHTFRLEITDNNRCKSTEFIEHSFEPSSNCSLRPRDALFCSGSNNLIRTVPLSFTGLSGGGGLAEVIWTNAAEMEGDSIQFLNNDWENPIVKINNILGEKEVRIKVEWREKNSTGCQDQEEIWDFLFLGAPILSGSLDFNPVLPDSLKDLCREGMSREWEIIGIVPRNNLRINYTVNGISKVGTVVNGSLRIPLEATKEGENQVVFQTFAHLGAPTCAGFEYEFAASSKEPHAYFVTECRQPQLVFVSPSPGDSICLYQKGYPLKVSDINSYRDFQSQVDPPQLKWLAFAGNQVLTEAIRTRTESDTLAYLYLSENHPIQSGDTILLQVVLERRFAGGRRFSDTLALGLVINDGLSPPPGTLALYPGNIFFFEWEGEEENTCMQWGVQLQGEEALPLDSTLDYDFLQDFTISSSGFALAIKDSTFIEKIFTSSGVSGEFKAYLWMDIWYDSSGDCIWEDINCGTRTYFNASLPPYPNERGQNPLVITNLYPNPSRGQVTLEWQHLSKETITVEVLDGMGHRIFEGQWPSLGEKSVETLPLGGVPPGIYLLRMMDPQGFRVVKLITIQ